MPFFTAWSISGWIVAGKPWSTMIACGAGVDRRGQVGGLLGVVGLGVVHRQVDAEGLGLRLGAVAPLLEVVAGAALADEGHLDRALAEGGRLLAGGGRGGGGGVVAAPSRRPWTGSSPRGAGRRRRPARARRGGLRVRDMRGSRCGWCSGDEGEQGGVKEGVRDPERGKGTRHRRTAGGGRPRRGRAGAPGEVSDSWLWSTGASPRTAAARAAASS